MESEGWLASEVVHLKRCEAIIERGLCSFLEVGKALLEIRDRRLYRSYGSFEDYCRDRWGLKRQRAYELIDVGKVAANLSEIPDKCCRESHLSPLIPLSPDQQRVVWEEAKATAPGGRLTAGHVKSVIDRLRDDEPSRPAPKAVDCDEPGLDEPGLDDPDHGGDVVEPTGPTESGMDQIDSLPIRSKLSNCTRVIFDSDVDLFRAARQIIDSFASDLRALLKTHDRRGAYHHDLNRILGVRHPKHWVVCPDDEFGGCSGTGLRSGIQCYVCQGRGYLKHALASQKQMAFLRRKGIGDVAGLNPGEAARKIGELIGDR